MKNKVILIYLYSITIILILTMFAFFGLQYKKHQTKTENFKSLIVDTINDFGDPEYLDDEYNNEDTYILGDAELLYIYEDEQLSYVYYEEGRYALIFDVIFDSYVDLDRNESAIWNIMITYIDIENEVSIDLDYYFYDRLLIPDYDNIIIDVSFNTFLEYFKLLDFEDFQDIISEIGYEDIIDPLTL